LIVERTCWTSVFLLALLLPVAGGTAEAQQPNHTQLAVESLIANQLSFDPQVDFARAYLAIEGPQGLRLGREFAPGGAIFMPLVKDEGGQLPDGLYHYRLSFTYGEGEKSLEEIQAQGSNELSGIFFVKDGTAVSRREQRAALTAHRNELNVAAESAAIPDPPGVTDIDDRLDINDTSADGTTAIFMLDDLSPSSEWDIYNNDGLFRISQFTPGTGESVFINDSGVGIGTSSPDGNLHISDDVPILNIDTTDQAERWQLYINPATDEFRIRDRVNFAHVVALTRGAPSDSIFVGSNGNVGIGTDLPATDLEVLDSGSVFTAMRLTNDVSSWAFSNTDVGVFTVNLIGSGGQEFTVGPRNNAAGPTMVVQGSVQATAHLSVSSRELKTDFATLDGKEVLANLATLPVTSWRYKTEDKDARHFGPVAEDFQAAFQLGDGKTIANIDANGVALAAIQGLRSMLLEKEAEIEAIKHANAALEERLASLEQKIE
jgi:hypothetical protein